MKGTPKGETNPMKKLIARSLLVLTLFSGVSFAGQDIIVSQHRQASYVSVNSGSAATTQTASFYQKWMTRLMSMLHFSL